MTVDHEVLRASGRRWLAAALAVILLAVFRAPATAQSPTVETLLARLFSAEDRTPYDLTADFGGTLTLIVRGAPFVAVAAGSFHEFRRADGIRRREVTITKLDLPVLLRPFSGTIKRIIAERVETQSETPETFHNHDIFINAEQPGRRYMLIGVHRTIVDEAIDRYGRPDQKVAMEKDPETRRRIAKWLYTSPDRRDTITRPGPPYALRAVLDDAGILYELTLFYDWGEVGTRISYIEINNQAVWRQVAADAVSEVEGLGPVNGKLLLNFTNHHCVNCRRR